MAGQDRWEKGWRLTLKSFIYLAKEEIQEVEQEGGIKMRAGMPADDPRDTAEGDL